MKKKEEEEEEEQGMLCFDLISRAWLGGFVGNGESGRRGENGERPGSGGMDDARLANSVEINKYADLNESCLLATMRCNMIRRGDFLHGVNEDSESFSLPLPSPLPPISALWPLPQSEGRKASRSGFSLGREGGIYGKWVLGCLFIFFWGEVRVLG